MITRNQLEKWLGSDIKKEGIITILDQMVNGFYPVEQLRRDIEQYEVQE